MVQAPTGGAIYAIGKHKVLAWINLYGGVANLALSLVLVQYLGLYGVVVGTVLESLVVRVFIYPRIACRLLDIPLSTYGTSVVSTFIKTVLCLLAVFLPLHFLLQPSYLALILTGFLQLFFSIPLLYILVLQPEDRALAKELFTALYRRKSIRQ